MTAAARLNPVFRPFATQTPLVRDCVSAVTQNRPLKVEIKGFKTGHFLEPKQLFWSSMARRRVLCGRGISPSDPTNDSIIFARFHAATNSSYGDVPYPSGKESALCY
jgi:hypothetical protein